MFPFSTLDNFGREVESIAPKSCLVNYHHAWLRGGLGIALPSKSRIQKNAQLSWASVLNWLYKGLLIERVNS